MAGPKVGEKWRVGGYFNLIYIGIARNLAQEKYFIFKDGESMFVISKDDFYSAYLIKEKQF